MKKTILIYKPQCEQVKHLIVMLQLANMSCTYASTALEAINWLAAHRLQVMTFDLVLICSFNQTQPEHQLLMDLQGLPLPAVFLQREDTPLANLVDHNVIICHPDDLLDCLNDCLTSTTHLTQGESIMTATEEVNRGLSSIWPVKATAWRSAMSSRLSVFSRSLRCRTCPIM